MERSDDARHCFVVPAASGVATGGNVYNEGLLAALSARGERWERWEPDAFLARPIVPAGTVWIDSLYFARITQLRAHVPRTRRVAALLHAFPSNLAHAEGRVRGALVSAEDEALAALDCALATSTTTLAELRLRAPRLCSAVAAPAIRRVPSRERGSGPLRALLVANLTRNKGLLPFLHALSTELRTGDALNLRCVGGSHADPAYAQACQQLVRESPALRGRVQLLGARSEREVLEELGAAHVLVSASRTESFGMVIADARAAGCVVLARAGGHVAQLVDPAAGGALFDDDFRLVEALLLLARDRTWLRERLALAAERPLLTRSWDAVAQDFLAHEHAHGAVRKAQ